MPDEKKKRSRKVTKGYVTDAKSKKVVKTNKKGSTTTKERVSQYNQSYLGHKPKDIPYGNKNIWEKKLKTKTNKEGVQTKRKEKIVFDEGNQMTKRSQRVVRFGRNKGKVKTRTVSYNKGSKTVNKGYSNVIDQSKL
tara:strand:- start:1190 stop:1600 length:411 start_codon:yes stop_codon:yes gene_type:complete